MNCLKWGSHVAKDCKAPKASTANLADDFSKSSKSGRHVTRQERSEDEEEYDNDTYYTDGLVKKKQLIMNVAHFITQGDDESDGNSNVDGSAGNSYVYKESLDDADAKSTGSSIDSRYPIVHSAYMINASDENGKRAIGKIDRMMMSKMMPVSRVISILLTK